MSRVTRGSTSSLLRGRREKLERDTLPSRLTNPNDVQKLVTRNVSDEQLNEITARRTGVQFQIEGITYRVSAVYRDELGRILEVGTRVSSE